jgi:hypothetical protein
MRRVQYLRIAALMALAVAAGSSGCTHNYYYGTGVPIYTRPANYNEVCDVPSTVSGGTVIVESPTSSTVASTSPAGSNVIVSEPQGAGPFSRMGSRFAWRRPEPEPFVTTRVEGAADDSTVTR